MLTVRLVGQHFVSSAQTGARYVFGSATAGAVWVVRGVEHEVSNSDDTIDKKPKKKMQKLGRRGSAALPVVLARQ
jgi:hypothetical protein